MALCDKCALFDRSYNEFRSQYDDVIEIDGDKREKKYCVMYSNSIPQNITYNNGDCPYFTPKDEI